MINFAIYFLEFVSLFLIVHIVFQTRARMDFAAAVLFLVSICVLYLAYITGIQFITYFVHVAFCIYSLYEFRRVWWETLLRFAGSIALGAILETVILMEVSSWSQTLNHSLFVYMGIGLGMLVCAAVLYWFFVCKRISFEIDVADKTFVLLIIVINVFVLYVKNEGNGRYLRLIVCIVSFVLLLAWFAMILKKGNKKRTMEETEWLSQYSKQYESLIQEVRRRQHDYKNEIQTLKTVCVTSEGAAVAMDIISECEDAEQYIVILNGCENPMIAGLVYCKMKDFAKEGVTMKSYIRMRNIDLALEVRDIIDIVGILLDNAFECTREQENKVMQFELRETEKGVLIKTSNPSPYITNQRITKMFTFGFSTKGKNRGIGLHTVRELVKKCRGEIVAGNHIVDNTNYFDLQVIVPLHGKCAS